MEVSAAYEVADAGESLVELVVCDAGCRGGVGEGLVAVQCEQGGGERWGSDPAGELYAAVDCQAGSYWLSSWLVSLGQADAGRELEWSFEQRLLVG